MQSRILYLPIILVFIILGGVIMFLPSSPLAPPSTYLGTISITAVAFFIPAVIASLARDLYQRHMPGFGLWGRLFIFFIFGSACVYLGLVAWAALWMEACGDYDFSIVTALFKYPLPFIGTSTIGYRSIQCLERRYELFSNRSRT